MTKNQFRFVAIAALLVLAGEAVHAFPPAPYHEIYGTLRDSRGNPMSQAATVILSTTEGVIARTDLDPTTAPGVNYSLKIAMDRASVDWVMPAP